MPRPFLQKRTKKGQLGFTIVELLIVIVIIGILAAITIVAFNGVQDKAKIAAAQAAATQANKKILAFTFDNADSYPVAAGVSGIDNLASIGIVNNGDTTYQYSSNNTTSPRTFCLTATKANKSTYVSNAVTSPTTGACPGHGSGGVAPITNLLANTSVETDLSNIQNIGNVGDRVLARTALPDAYNGGYVFRLTAGPSGAIGGYGSLSSSLPVGSYTGSLWLRSNTSLTVNPYFEGSSVRVNGTSLGAALTPGVWKQISRTFDITTAGTVKVGFLAGSTILQDQYVEIDGFMLTTGSTVYAFANGNSSNWVWNGTADNSSSTGTPL